MTNQEILIKVVEKAERQDKNYSHGLFPYSMCKPEEIIFSHDFAKAFWGEGIYVDTDEGKEMWIKQDNQMTQLNLEDWQYHLQQMVLEENPIKYLEQFL